MGQRWIRWDGSEQNWQPASAQTGGGGGRKSDDSPGPGISGPGELWRRLRLMRVRAAPLGPRYRTSGHGDATGETLEDERGGSGARGNGLMERGGAAPTANRPARACGPPTCPWLRGGGPLVPTGRRGGGPWETSRGRGGWTSGGGAGSAGGCAGRWAGGGARGGGQ